MKVFDLHCDTLYLCGQAENHSLRENDGHIDLKRLAQSGSMAQCFAIFVEGSPEDHAALPPYEYYRHILRIYRAEMEKNRDLIRPAFTVEDIKRNREAGILSSVLTVENGAPLEGKIERVDEFYRDGARMMSLTWNYETEAGYPNSDNQAIMSRGLKPFGLECVERMNELGMVIDVSHLSDGGFWDVVHHSKKPFAASHSNCRALCPVSRNLTDEQMRALGECGGVIGVNFFPEFLDSTDSHYGTIDSIVRHIEHMVNVAGIDAAAMGSDFDGFSAEMEMEGCQKYPALIHRLEQKFSPAEIDKICGENALRLFREVGSTSYKA